MEEEIKQALITHAQGHIDKHVMNVKILMRNCVGIGEHGDVLEEIEKELPENVFVASDGLRIELNH